MAMLAFSHFEKFKNQFQLIRHFIHDTTLDEIYQHGQYLFGDNQAQKYEDEIWELIKKLLHNYLIFPECRYLRTKSKMYRWIILDAHLLIYRITTQKEIQLLRILHSKRSISKIKTSRKIKP